MSLQVYEYKCDGDQWSIPDHVMKKIWERLVKEGKDKTLFYGGLVTNDQEFISFMRRPGYYPMVVWDTETQNICHLIWLNDLGPNFAYVHHASVGKYRRGSWKAFIDYIKQFDVFDILLGLTPVSFKKAVKILRMVKWEIVGVIPHVCIMADGSREPGILSYFDIRGE